MGRLGLFWVVMGIFGSDLILFWSFREFLGCFDLFWVSLGLTLGRFGLFWVVFACFDPFWFVSDNFWSV